MFNKLIMSAVEEVKGANLPNLREVDIDIDFNDPAYELRKSRFLEGGKAILKFVAQLETPLLRQISIKCGNNRCWSEPTAQFIKELLNVQTHSLRTFEFMEYDDGACIGIGSLLTIVDNPNIEGSVSIVLEVHTYNRTLRPLALTNEQSQQTDHGLPFMEGKGI
jgi:hypothetical protein